MTLDEQIAKKKEDIKTMQLIASNSTSDGATRVYESRLNEFFAELRALERQRKQEQDNGLDRSVDQGVSEAAGHP